MAKGKVYDDGFSELPIVPASAAAAGIGHNKPPTQFPIGPELDERLAKAHADKITRADELIAASPKFRKVTDVKTLKRSTEHVRQIQASLTVLESQRKGENEPYRVGKAQVDGFFGQSIDDLNREKAAIEKSMNAYNNEVKIALRKAAELELAKKRAAEKAKADAAEKAKRDAEAAAAKLAESKKASAKALEKAAVKEVEARHAVDALDDAKAETTQAERQVARPAADLTRQRSANAVQSQQEFLDFRGFDRNLVDLEALRAHIPIDAFGTAIRSYIRANQETLKTELKNRRQPVRGVEFFMNDRTRVGG
jgi:chromosome segregation ATPase